MEGEGYGELQLLQASAMDEEFQWRGTVEEVAQWKANLAAYEAGEQPREDTVHFSLWVSRPLGVWLNVSLNIGNQNTTQPVITATNSREDLLPANELNQFVQDRQNEIARENISNPVFDIYTSLKEYVSAYEEHVKSPLTEPLPEEITKPSKLDMKRIIFWSHHLIAPSKRKQFAAWCPELHVWGLFKLGYPGFLCFEGLASDVDEMVRRVKSMQWHAISARVEVTYTYSVTEKDTDPSTDALKSCTLARGRDIPTRSKLRVDSEEINDMGEFVASPYVAKRELHWAT
ncbi:hypothetical protein MPSI1_002665 [Malassezia psittaci]|uniref:Small nuclear ribonucleoprotein Prp3 C-terminal domain-containing protein n=1 Tax=Malassezia psittaci TaxID=1821823 RepID=A0AAF0FAT2_9BASI|nr:hypothetical protein MPSI1_002665 [Malassezia psittaci]